MKRSSLALLAAAVGLHAALLGGWRWQLPLVPYFFDATVLSGGRGLDFYALYQAGHNARVGADVYEGDPAVVPVVVPYFTPYRYLPAVAYLVGAPLSLLSSLTAYKLWVGVVELALLACVAATWRRVTDRDLFARLALMWLVFTPFYLELFMGQFSFVQAALVFGMLLAAGALSDREPSGQTLPTPRAFDLFWILSILWKINTMLFAPVILRLRRIRALAWAGALVALASLPYFALFPAHLRDFAANNFGRTVAGHELGNLGFRQLVFESLAVLGAGAQLQQLTQGALVAAVLAAALLLTFRAPLTQTSTRGLLSLWLTAFFLVSPQVWEHHYVMLLPVLVVAYWERPGWLVFGLWLALALPTPFGFIGLQPVIAANHDLRAFRLEPAWQPLLQHASKAVPAGLLFLFLAWGLARSRAPEKQPASRLS